MDPAPLDVLVLGAGVSGLAAARELSRGGLRVAAIDKGRGPGGRMATRRTGPGPAPARFDHGAQYFTARDPAFAAQAEVWERAGIARKWSDGFATEAGPFRRDGEVRWCGVDGMASVARSLGEGLDVRVATKATAVHAEGGAWSVSLEDGSRLAARALVATAPVPQTLALLDAGGTVLPAAAWDALDAIEYSPCIAALLRTDQPSRIPAPGGLWGRGEPLAWIADNRAKGVSRATNPGAELTIHAGPEFSHEHFDEPESVVVAHMLDLAAAWIGGAVIDAQMHRWRYAMASRVHPERTLVVAAPAVVAFAGDAFNADATPSPRIETAYLSGLAAAAEVAARLR
jgi:predicted NAD/FAD-dependent oxidoreductase